MADKCIVTYAAGAHEELLDISLPRFKEFAHRHGYDVVVGQKRTDRPAPWNKIPLMLEVVMNYEASVWLDCDLVIVDPSEDFPPINRQKHSHALVRHFEDGSEVPNSGVWILQPNCVNLLKAIWELEVFTDHGWWEQAALMTLMGYTVPTQGSEFRKTKCKCVKKTLWYEQCQFMRLCYNSHPNYRADKPRIIHCSYTDMQQRIEVMRALVKDPTFNYPRYDSMCESCKRGGDKEDKKPEKIKEV